MQNKIELLARTNGCEKVCDQTIEECAELIVALRHYARFGTGERITQISEVWSEIADVEIMLEQLKYCLYGEKEVEKIKAEKIERQLKRFGLKGTGK